MPQTVMPKDRKRDAMLKKKKKYGLWPSIHDIDSTKDAIKQGTIASGLIAIVTAIFATASVLGYEIIDGFSFEAIFDALIFTVIGWGIHKKSRAAALSGLFIYVVERLYMWSNYGLKNPIIAFFITLMFINSIRGTISYHDYRKSKILTKNVFILNLLALLYSIIILILLAIVAFVVSPQGALSTDGELIYILILSMAFITYSLTLDRLMPFTKNKFMVEFSLPEEAMVSDSYNGDGLEEAPAEKILSCPDCDFTIKEKDFKDPYLFCPVCRSILLTE